MRAFPLAVKRGWWDNPGVMTAASLHPPHSPRAGIGKPLRRLEDGRLLTGRGCYSDDFNIAGQAYAVVVRSPHAHARLTAIETEHVWAMPGVLAVLTGADYVADGLGPMMYSPAARHPPDIRLENLDRVPASPSRQYPLVLERTRFVGEAVAFVVAETLAAAKDAAEAVSVDYVPLTAVTSSSAAALEDAPSLLEEGGSNLVLDARVGDHVATESAFAAAAHIARLSTWVQRVTGVPMEPRAALAEFDAASGRITLYAGGGSIGRPRQDVAAMLGLPQGKVRVIARDVGGNFGTRNSSYPEFALVAWAARRLGRPVKWTGERQETFLSDHQARDLEVEAELALDAEGKFLALRASNLSNLGAYAASFVPLTKGTELMSSLYRIPAARAQAQAVLSNTPPTSPYRSAGRPEVMFVIERLIDLAARANGFDRVALRRKNLIPPASLPYPNPFGMTYDSGDYHAVLDRALALADWAGFAARRAEGEARSRRRGIGLGAYVESQSGAPQERAEVTVQPEGIVEMVVGTLSSGQGHETSFAQLLGEWLGVQPETVRLVTGDTDRVLIGAGSHSGRSLRLASTTAHGATGEIVEKGRRIAAHRLEAAEADIEFTDGRFTVAGTDRSLDLFAVAAAARDDASLPEELRGPLVGIGEVTSEVASFPHGFHVCEVEIDPDTGLVDIARYTAVDDVGRAVNPLILHGQTHGGIAQGAGQALLEQCVYDPASGQLLSGSFMDYAMPRAADLPFFTTAISEVPSTTHPLGLRGGGEGGITPALGVIVNAIVDALADLGVTHLEMPVTPERVWRAIRAGGE
ncbi:MAG TPA: xanthine dehydrogenase family protein molybdopterin-binding subunit [Stellaceae bacterium]|nr:xanthine dehydrogenase family protein molybdopterin-binding subunit [Stellaceae bacterium]